MGFIECTEAVKMQSRSAPREKNLSDYFLHGTTKRGDEEFHSEGGKIRVVQGDTGKT